VEQTALQHLVGEVTQEVTDEERAVRRVGEELAAIETGDR